MFRNKSNALDAVVDAAERATAADTTWGRGSRHSAESRRGAAEAVADARAAGATDEEIRSAVASRAFKR
jgi:hypothetical protein